MNRGKLFTYNNVVHYLRQVLGSEREFHFIHRMVPHARMKRSVSHTRLLKLDPMVSVDVSIAGLLAIEVCGEISYTPSDVN